VTAERPVFGPAAPCPSSVPDTGDGPGRAIGEVTCSSLDDPPTAEARPLQGLTVAGSRGAAVRADLDAVSSTSRRTMRDDPTRLGLSVARASWLVGVRVREYRGLEEASAIHDFETWDRICKLYGWPQTFLNVHAVGSD
jgi:hypothetical protein